MVIRAILRKPVFDLDFVWYRPHDGITRHGVDSPAIPHEWKPSASGFLDIEADELVYSPSEVLTPPSEAIWFGIGGHLEKYQPFRDYPLLHRTFCALHCQPGAVKELANRIEEFASKYGLLGISPPHVRPNNPELQEPLVIEVESLTQWAIEIEDLREAVDLWDSLRSDDCTARIRKLEDLIQRTDQGFWGQSRSLGKALSTNHALKDTIEKYRRALEESGAAVLSGSSYIAGPSHHDQFLEDWRARSDNVGPAKQYLTCIINEKLKGNISPQFELVIGRTGKELLRTSITPRNLLGALWFQFFLEVMWNNTRKCPVCQEWFYSQDPRQIYCHKHGSGCRKKADCIRHEIVNEKSHDYVAGKYGITQDDLDGILERSSNKQARTSN